VPAEEADSLRDAYATVLEVREEVTKQLEEARNEKLVGKSQEGAVIVHAPADATKILEGRGLAELADMFIVSSVELHAGDELSVRVGSADGEKCPRCWNYRVLAESDVCSRCAKVLAEGTM